MMIDINAALTSVQFAHDADAVLENALADGIAHVIVTGSCVTSCIKGGLLARTFGKGAWFSAGVGPRHVEDYRDSNTTLLDQLWADHQCVAIGECGLDYRAETPKAIQQHVLAKQLEKALENRKPVILRCGDNAYADLQALVAPYAAAGLQAVVHNFKGSASTAEKLQNLGLELGLTGWITEEANKQLAKNLLAAITLPKLHLASDAPYSSPKNCPALSAKFVRNEPKYLPWLALAIEDLKGCSVEELVWHTQNNSKRLFKLPSLSLLRPQ